MPPIRGNHLVCTKKINLHSALRVVIKKSLLTLVLTLGFGGALATFTHTGAAAPSGRHGGKDSMAETSVAVAAATKADIPIIRQSAWHRYADCERHCAYTNRRHP